LYLKVADIVVYNKFWDNVNFAFKLFSTPVKVLQQVDGYKLSMRFLYDNLENARGKNERNHKLKEKKYIPM